MSEITGEYKYDAFISYRHDKRDSYVAERIHRRLETYRLPKSLVGSVPKSGVKRVFRDREELPLTDNLNDYIIGALNDSEHLIVICSPRLKESEWCRKEISTFVENHGREKVMLVLCEGEPEDSFPAIMLEGNAEPLAADVRADSLRATGKKIKNESLRILAPMLGVDYDDLKQRNRERHFKKVVSFAAVIIAVLVAFLSYVSYSLIEISKQSDIIKENQAIVLADESREMLSRDSRFRALNTAVSALTSYDGIKMPYTSDAQYALTDALRVYDSAQYSKALLEINAQDTIVAMECNQAPFELVMQDYSGYVAVWDYATFSKVFESYDGIIGSDDKHIAGFINPGTIFYINSESHITIYDVNSGEVKAELADADFARAYAGANGKYLAALNDSGIYVYSLDDYSLAYYNALSEENSTFYKYSPYVMIDEENGQVVFAISKKDEGGVIAVADINRSSIVYSFKHKNGVLEYASGHNGTIYCLTHEEGNVFSATTILAFDPDKKETLWEDEFNGNGTELRITDNGKVLAIAGHNAYYYSGYDGRLIECYSFDSKIGCVDETADQFFIRTVDGVCGGIRLKNGKYTSYGKLIDCTMLSELRSIKVNDYYYAYVGIPKEKNNDQIIFYNYKDNSYAQEYTGEVENPQYLTLFDNDALGMVEKWNLDTDNAVYSIIATKEKSYAVISYKNGNVRVYDMVRGVFTDEMDIGTTLSKYLGEDIYRNGYFAGDRFAICVDSNMKIIAGIEDMEGVSTSKESIIMDTVDNNRRPARLAYKIYSLDELIQLANEANEFYYPENN